MVPVNSLPTIFALEIAKGVDLYDDGDRDIDQRLKHFQLMAITSSFEEALIAYHGSGILEVQRDALETIYNSTRPWLLGHVAGVIMNMMSDPKTAVDAAKLVLAIVQQEGAVSEETQNRLIIKLANTK